MRSTPHFGPVPLLCDGNPATELDTGESPGHAPVEALNQTQPERVQLVHRSYVQAGARLLRTNTEQAQARQLDRFALTGRAEAINNSGSALARGALTAEHGNGFVMGTLGPPVEPGTAGEPEQMRAYAEQVIYLSDTGVDFLLLQHVAHLSDAVALARCIKGITDAPLLAAIQLNADGLSLDGRTAAATAQALVLAGADALGLSCGPGPRKLEECTQALLDAGLPVAVLAAVSAESSMTPVAFADWLFPLAEQGVTLLGGCCGATPAHIAALNARLADVPPGDETH